MSLQASPSSPWFVRRVPSGGVQEKIHAVVGEGRQDRKSGNNGKNNEDAIIIIVTD
jgi:hypothetical protein